MPNGNLEFDTLFITFPVDIKESFEFWNFFSSNLSLCVHFHCSLILVAHNQRKWKEENRKKHENRTMHGQKGIENLISNPFKNNNSFSLAASVYDNNESEKVSAFSKPLFPICNTISMIYNLNLHGFLCSASTLIASDARFIVVPLLLPIGTFQKVIDRIGILHVLSIIGLYLLSDRDFYSSFFLLLRISGI